MHKLRLVKAQPIDVEAFLLSPLPTRWTPRRKAALVPAVRSGQISLFDAGIRYRLTVDEFTAWESRFDDAGLAGLHLKCRAQEGARRSPRRGRPTKSARP